MDKAIGFLDVAERQDCLYLQNIEIVPSYQGNGIGTTSSEALWRGRMQCIFQSRFKSSA